MDSNPFDKILNRFGFGLYQISYAIFISPFVIADGAEIQVLSIFSPYLSQEWSSTPIQISVLNMMVFVGYAIGASSSGLLSVYLGRKKTLVLINVFWTIFAVLSSLAMNIYELIVYRFFFGIGVGAVWPLGFAMLAEVCPNLHRGKYLSVFQSAYALGESFGVLIAFFTLNKDYIHDWRVLFGITAFLPFISLIFTLFCVEDTSRSLLVSGEIDKGIKVLLSMGKKNNKNAEDYDGITEEERNNLEEWGKKIFNKEKKSDSLIKDQIASLFADEFKYITPLIWFLWFSNNFLFFGISLLIPYTLKRIGETDSDSFGSMLIICGWEFLSSILSVFIIDSEYIGRKKLILITTTITIVVFIIVCIDPTFYYVFLMTIAKSSQNISYNTNYIWTAELFPTKIRASGIGSASTFCRLGPIIMPWVTIYLIDYGLWLPYLLFAIVGFMTLIIVMMIKHETTNKDLDTLI